MVPELPLPTKEASLPVESDPQPPTRDDTMAAAAASSKTQPEAVVDKRQPEAVVTQPEAVVDPWSPAECEAALRKREESFAGYEATAYAGRPEGFAL